jgi:thiamine biosynthesis lipoprotein
MPERKLISTQAAHQPEISKKGTRDNLVLFLCLLISCLVIIPGCNNSPDPLALGGKTMGTTWSVVLVDNVETDSAEMTMEIQAVLDEIESIFSTYQSDSEINWLNLSPAGVAVPVSEPLYFVLDASKQMSIFSEGAFDVTVAPLIDLWGFGSDQMTGVPDQSTIDDALDRTGYQWLILDPEERTVTRMLPVSVNLSAIAKGYAVDRLSQMLISLGHKNYMVEVGGEIMTRGNNPRGSKWRLAIEKPQSHPGQRVVELPLQVSGKAVATSGDYRNFIEHEGKLYSHTINPETGWPVNHQTASVTVVSPSAMEADAWATALNVAGSDFGMKLADKYKIPVCFIDRAETVEPPKANPYNVQCNQPMQAYLEKK